MEAGITELLALEVSPGMLLRITSNTGEKFFSEATQALDPAGTAGHLVSIVVADGFQNTPTALLANHMESSLAAAAAREGRILCFDSLSLCFKILLPSLLLPTFGYEEMAGNNTHISSGIR